jgi:hypothetical protein
MQQRPIPEAKKPAPRQKPSESEKMYSVDELKRLRGVLAPEETRIVVNTPPSTVIREPEKVVEKKEPRKPVSVNKELSEDELKQRIRQVSDDSQRLAAEMLLRQGKLNDLKKFLAEKGLL